MTSPNPTEEGDPSGPQGSTSDATATGQKSNPEDDAAAAAAGGPTPEASTPDGNTGPKKAPSNRPRAATMKAHPTLLGDFLLGRPSAARVAADRQAAREAARQRRQSLELVKQEMRQAALLRVQAPGGVHDRVKKWQKANAEAMAKADPLATPTEPSEVNIQVEEESVTEEDRVRIKMRQKRKPHPKGLAVEQKSAAGDNEENQKEMRSSSPPKKRVVSDTNWVKNQGKSPPKKQVPKPKPNEGSGMPLPKDFLLRPTANPSASKKIKDWASRVEIPDEPIKRPGGYARSTGSASHSRVRSMPSVSDITSGGSETTQITVGRANPPKSPKPQDDGIRVRPIRASTSKDDGIRVKPQPRSLPDDGIRIRPMPSSTPNTAAKGKAKASATQQDDGIRVKPPTTRLPDDGIRVRAIRQPSIKATPRAIPVRQTPKVTVTRRTSGRKAPSPPPCIVVIEEKVVEKPKVPARASSSARPGPRGSLKLRPKPAASYTDTSTVTGTEITGTSATVTDVTGTEVTGTTGTTDSRVTGTGTYTTGSYMTSSYMTGTDVTGTEVTGSEETATKRTRIEVIEDISDSESWTSSESEAEPERPSSAPGKSLADIPFGYSAFSELELPMRPGGRPMQRSKTTKHSGLKGATNVLRRALTEGKKILTEKTEPPKPVHNQPPNIENWLKDTVDPFVEGAKQTEKEPQRKSSEDEWVDEPTPSPKRRASTPRRRSAEQKHVPTSAKKEDRHAEPKHTEPKPNTKPKVDEPTPKQEVAIPLSPTLRRSRATRVSSSSLKSANKKGFKDVLRDAFRGESTGHTPPTLEYSSYEEVKHVDEPHIDDYQERRRSSSVRRSQQYDDDHSTRRSQQHDDDHSTRRSQQQDDDYSDDDSSVTVEPVRAVPPPLYPKRRPPTNGFHELSTIVSGGDDAFSTLESEISSMVSDTTITHTTGLTRSTALSRKRSQNPGLKRRLTKHSDLVSVLSLPDNTATLRSSRSLRATRSVRRPTNHLDHATVEGLLQEFANDEDLYQRELKTVVDGVIPVLLTHLVYGDGSSAKDLFGPSCSNPKEDKMSKAVVNMGVFLEKLKNQHRRCPLSDVHRLPQWLESVQGIYESYLDVWRLGFQGIIVNLAPASPDDMDSLVNAMPRNEQGDVVNEHGDRIDVAHLLKRPLVRVKWIARFIKGYRAVTGTNQYEALASKWEALQLKARRRYKEEVARVVDDDAKYTDTSRVRDLRTMGALDNVRIDRFRQVYAKDEFSLNLRHSNGQRIDCQVELIYRDNQYYKTDPGDLLIREAGSEGRSWLLFAPVTGGHYSARRGDGRLQLVVMIRGYNNEWYELITLTTDSEEQVLDWLNILGSDPMPPELSAGVPLGRQSSVLSQKASTGDAPLGERRSLRQKSRTSPAPIKVTDDYEERPKTPSRYHRRNGSFPTTPTSSSPKTSTHSPQRTPTQDSYMKPRHGSPEAHPEDDYEDHSLPLREDLRPKPLTLRKASPNSTPFRQDGAPPPPIHRTLGSQKSPTLAPPPEKGHPTLKRRTSSPLKHEYHPSDISSESSFSTSESEDDISISDESSDDELEAADMPNTAPAISIKRETDIPTDSLISESVVSLTPSASASQAGMSAGASQHPDYLFKSLATISYWDNKHGCWKDLWPDVCSIVTTPGLIEAYPLRRSHTSSDDPRQDEERPLIALDLTPLVMLRNSTALDLEIRSPVLSYARLYSKVTKVETSFFRFRAPSFQECETLYMAAHRARMDNAKYKALEEETRVRSFGQHRAVETDDEAASQHRSWFGRKNSYRASARAPSQSAGSISHSSISATSFLKRILGGAGNSFNIAMSSVDRPSRSGSRENSLYSSESPPRSPSVSAANSSRTMKMSLTTNNLKIRLHLLISASKWEDHGNCYLEVARPDRGTRQNLRKYQGMEKRIIVTSIPKKDKDADKAVVKLDVVLGSRCFSRLGSRGILLNVWEEVKDESGETGVAPKGGNTGGNVNKWCFQCASVMEASWIFGLVTQEVVIG